MQSFKKKALVSFGLFLLVVLFARNLPGGRSTMQLQFDRWLSAREKIFTAAAQSSNHLGAETPRFPMLSLDVVSDQPIPRRFMLGQGSDPDRILRLLVLMRESNVFTISDRSDALGALTLKVQDGENVFEANFAEDEVQDNVQARTMLKLFEQFAVPLDAVVNQGDKV